MPYKRKTSKRKTSSRPRKVAKKTIRSIVRQELKPSQVVIRKQIFYAAHDLASNFVAYPLSSIYGANNLFGTTVNDLHRNQAKHVKMNLDFTIRSGDEKQGSDLTVYIVSLRDDVKDEIFDSTSGSLQPVLNEDYSIMNGSAYLNPRTFRIHKRYPIMFPAKNSVVDPRFNLQRRFYWTCSPNKLIRNERGDFNNLAMPHKPSHNYYVIVFNNNSILDGEAPTFEAHCLNTYIA